MFNRFAMQDYQILQQLSRSTWSFIDNARGHVDVKDAVISILYVLYGMHKGYEVSLVDNRRVVFNNDSDRLLKDLQKYDIHHEWLRPVSFYKELSALPKDKFEQYYPDLIVSLMDKAASTSGRAVGEFFTSSEITSLLAYFSNKMKCKSVYDPFCGTASIVRELIVDGEPALFKGQDMVEMATLFARLNVEAMTGRDDSISWGDSISQWDTSHFDAIVTCPPIGLRIQPSNYDRIAGEKDWPCRSITDMVLSRGFSINGANVVMLIESLGFCSRLGFEEASRRFLVDHNYLDKVIRLPEGMMYGSSMPSVLVICRADRRMDEPILFADAKEFFIGDRLAVRTFDLETFITRLEGDCKGICKYVSCDDVIDHSYNIIPSLYCSEDVTVAEGQKVVRLSELLSPVHGHLITPEEDYVPVPANIASGDFISVLLNKDKTGDPNDQAGLLNKGYDIIPEIKYLISFETASQNRYALRTDGKNFRCGSVPTKVFSINEELVTPEYLVYLLTNDELLKQKGITLSSILSRWVVIEGKQKQAQLVDKVLQEYGEKNRESQEAEARRLGIKRNISDLEHMLGATQLRIDDIITTLEEIKPDSDNYQHTVKSLKDNIEYMNRMIKYSNSDISADTFNKKEADLGAFIEGYADAWRNYGGGYFTLDTVNRMCPETVVSFDKVMLTVMLDSILSNAVRHGFHKRKNYTKDNRVEIELSEVEKSGKPFVLMRVSNNGDPISEDFTIKDYIYRGRHASATGRSGLGGYHVYKIVKGHEGFLHLDSTKIWNVIVEVLLPLQGEINEDMESYENECI